MCVCYNYKINTHQLTYSIISILLYIIQLLMTSIYLTSCRKPDDNNPI